MYISIFFYNYKSLSQDWQTNKLICLPTVGLDQGYIYSEATMCLDATTIRSSFSHGNPYDCLQLCEQTDNCNAYLFSPGTGSCIVMGTCDAMWTMNQWDAYLKIGNMILFTLMALILFAQRFSCNEKLLYGIVCLLI